MRSNDGYIQNNLLCYSNASKRRYTRDRNMLAMASVNQLEPSYETESFVNISDVLEILRISKKKLGKDLREWIPIKKPELVELVSQTYFDPDKKKILDTISKKPATITQIMDMCNLPLTLSYRKINSLKKSGLIISAGYEVIRNKKVKKYLAVFEDVIIRLNKETIGVRVRIMNETLNLLEKRTT